MSAAKEARIHYFAPSRTLNPLDMHKELKSRNVEQTKGGNVVVASSLSEDVVQGHKLDVSTWLRQAAPHYHISPDIRDHVIVPVVTIPADLPNRNGAAFPLNALMEFLPDEGMLAYQTFKGKPTYYEHKNTDITKAKGVIIDTFLRPMVGFGNGKQWKLVKLLSFDRTKDSQLCDRILKGDINTYSMGAYIRDTVCSVCGLDVGEMKRGECSHIHYKRTIPFFKVRLPNGQFHLCHKVMYGIKGFECSSVESPAWMPAISHDVLRVMREEVEREQQLFED